MDFILSKEVLMGNGIDIAEVTMFIEAVPNGKTKVNPAITVDALAGAVTDAGEVLSASIIQVPWRHYSSTYSAFADALRVTIYLTISKW